MGNNCINDHDSVGNVDNNINTIESTKCTKYANTMIQGKNI